MMGGSFRFSALMKYFFVLLVDGGICIISWKSSLLRPSESSNPPAQKFYSTVMAPKKVEYPFPFGIIISFVLYT